MRASTRAKLAAIFAALETQEEWHEARQLMRDASNAWERRLARTLIPGSRVQFPGRGGKVETGTLVRVHQTSADIKSDSGVQWRVSPSLLILEKPKPARAKR